MEISRVEQKRKMRLRQRSHFFDRFLVVWFAVACLVAGGVVYLFWYWINLGAPFWPYLLGGVGAVAVVPLAQVALQRLKDLRFTLPRFPKLPKVTKPKFPFGRRDTESYIGLDVGTSSIKVVQVANTKQGPKIVQYGILPTPAKAVENGVIKDREVVVHAVRQLFQERKIRQTRVITVLTGQNLIVRHVEFPQMSEKELREALKWEAEQYIPIPKADSVVDFQVVPHSGQIASGDKMQVMLVATYRQPIQDYIDLVKAAHLQPQAIDIEPLAVLRALQIGQPPVTGVTVVVDMGAGTTNLSIFARGVLQMARVIPIAGNDLTQAIADGTGVPFVSAEARKKAGGMLDDEIVPLMQPIIDRQIGEIRRSIEFFLFKNRDLSLSRVWLVGGSSCLKGFHHALEQDLALTLEKLGSLESVSVEVGHPALNLELDPLISGEVRLLDTILAPALGLALREVVS